MIVAIYKKVIYSANSYWKQ